MSKKPRPISIANFSLRFGILLAALALAASALLTKRVSATNPTPASGTLTAANTPSNPLVYTGGPFAVANTTGLVGLQCNALLACDDFTLIVDLPDSMLDTHEVRVRISWPNYPTTDYDVIVYKGAALFGQAGSSSMPEYVGLPAMRGTYKIRTVPFNPLGTSYTAQVTVNPKAPTKPAGTGLVPVFRNFVAPANMGNGAGEPSIGANWKTGKIMYTGGLDTYRVTFTDSAAPTSALWEDVSAPTSAESLDPIMFTDRVTGRTVVSQLFGTTSLSSFSDDDGASWTPSEGGGMTSGVDHQTVGGGPFHAPMPQLPSPAYNHAIYYCSQQLYTAFCARSDDGGLTYGPTVPIYTSECGGIHGHVKVSPDGTVYVPNHNCGENQGVAMSEDNGITWKVRTIADGNTSTTIGDSAPSDWDPSLGAGRGDKVAGGRIYFGYKHVDGHAHVAVSDDHGQTWKNDQDVAPMIVRNTAFPTVVAGDDDRAAFAFLGTDKPGGDPTALWYLYVSTTYDGGKSWVTVNATPNDPVQRGSICSLGLGCNGDRNLLDFMDATVDKEGRILVGYADGCTGNCVTNAPPFTATAKATIARQMGGRRLLAASDPKGDAQTADFDGDRRTDVSVFRPGSNDWLIHYSATDSTGTRNFGASGDLIVPGDYDGDGKVDVAVWRPSDGTWRVRRSSDGATATRQWGASTDRPVAADYDGDGVTDFAVFRPSDSNWYIIQSSNNQARVQGFGAGSDRLVPADYDGDGKADIAVWRPSDGIWRIIRSVDGVAVHQALGQAGDAPVPGDYDGDGRTELAVYHPADGRWYTRNLTTGAQTVRQWGAPTDSVVPGDYDGDGKTDVAIFREAESKWYISLSGDGSTRFDVLGVGGDVLVPPAYFSD